jgi:hypothetical protein
LGCIGVDELVFHFCILIIGVIIIYYGVFGRKDKMEIWDRYLDGDELNFVGEFCIVDYACFILL